MLVVQGTRGCDECLSTRKELRPLFSEPTIRYTGKGPLKFFPDRAGRLHFHPSERFEQAMRCEKGHSRRMSWPHLCWCGWKAKSK